MKIDSNALVIGFVGRLNQSKGIPELYEAFLLLLPRFPSLRLLLVGDYDGTDSDAVTGEVRARIDADARVVRTGWMCDPAPYYHAMDVFGFPTHREGFGLVSIEAQASEVPVVATTATGVRDSVLDGISGFLTPVGDVKALAQAMERLLRDAELRSRMGAAGHSWVARTFDRRIVWADIKERYIQAGNPPLPLPLHE
jgi:glycosyltransferase involved in cell wall biosynthesis